MSASQSAAILAALQRGETVTPESAYRLCGTHALHSRIAELRSRGHAISCQLVEIGGKSVGKYSLIVQVLPTVNTLGEPNRDVSTGISHAEPDTPTGKQADVQGARSDAAPILSSAAPDQSMVYDDKGKPFYIAVGWGVGHPPDQDHLYAKRGRA